MCCAPDFPEDPPKETKGNQSLPARLDLGGLSAQTKGKKTVSFQPKPASSWLGQKPLCRAQRICVRLHGLMVKAKGQPLSQVYVASRQDALCSAQKSLSPLPRTPYFLNTLSVRLKHDALTAQSSCLRPRPEPRSNALPAQDRQLSSVQAYGLTKVRTHGSTYGEPKVLPLGWSLSERQKDLIKRDQKTPASMTVLIWQVELICPYRTNCLLTQVGFARSHN